MKIPDAPFSHNQQAFDHCTQATILIRVDMRQATRYAPVESAILVVVSKRDMPQGLAVEQMQWWAETPQAQHVMAVLALQEPYRTGWKLYYGMSEEEWETIWSSMPA